MVENTFTQKWLDEKLEWIVNQLMTDPGIMHEDASTRIQAYAEILFIFRWLDFESSQDIEDELWSRCFPDSLSSSKETQRCTWCFATDHTELYCPEVPAEELPPDDSPYSWNDDICVYDTDENGEYLDVNGKLLGLEEEYDGVQVLIPSDPLEKCYSPAGILYSCYCPPEEEGKNKLECLKCSVGRELPTYEWRPYREDGVYDPMRRRKKNKKGLNLNKSPASTTVVPKTTVPKTTTSKTVPAYKGYQSKDRHYGDTYTTPNGEITIYVSSVWNSRTKDDKTKPYFMPDFGLYFDGSWKPTWRNEFIAWPDYGIPDSLSMAVTQIADAVDRIRKGQKVEFGCIGGHGRTGTALAVVDVLLGCEPEPAIEHVRENHCQHAIESSIQEWFVKWVYAQIKNEDPPPKPKHEPKYNYSSSYSSYGTYGTGCAKLDHFIKFAEGVSVCPKDRCGYWDIDYKEFMQGTYPLGIKGENLNHSNGKVVDGYLVPKQVAHYVINMKSCFCDVCRYIAAGHGAFLMPVNNEEKQKWINSMDVLEAKTITTMANRQRNKPKKLIEVPKTNESFKLKMADHQGKIMEITTTSEFLSKNPIPEMENPTDGQREGFYVYIEGQGWIYTPITTTSKVEV